MNPSLFLDVFGAALAALLNTFLAAAGVAGLAWIALRCLPRVNAATRYVAWWAVLAAIVMIAAVPFLPVRSAAELSSPVAAPAPVMMAPVLPQVAELAIEPVEVQSGLWVLGVFTVWALVCLWRVARMGRSYFVVRGLRRRSRLAPPEIASVFDRQRMECGIERPARLLLSHEVAAPIAVGFLRPVVILPESLVHEFSAAELDHVLLHELAHVARYDDWTNLLARAGNALLGLHPVAAFVIARIDRERENACDDWVVARTGAARPYAASLTRVFELTHSAKPLLASGMAERGSKLGERVERLLERGRVFTSGVSMEVLAVSLLVLIGLVFAAGQSPTLVAFAEQRMPMRMVLDTYTDTHRPLLTKMVFYAPQAPTAPQAPLAPAPPASPAPPSPPRPPSPPAAPAPAPYNSWLNDEVRWTITQVEREAMNVQAQLRAAQERLRATNSAEARAQLGEVEARMAQVQAQLAARQSRKPLVQELIDAGMTNLSVDEIVELSKSGVTPQYLRGLKEAGITDLTPAQILTAIQSGVRPQDIRTAREYKRDISLDDIIKLKQNGAL